MVTITNDEILFTCELKLDRISRLSLWKQSYSDGTCFYTLQDENKNWKVEYGSRDLKELIAQLEHELKVEEEYKSHELMEKYPFMIHVYNEVKKWRENILSNVQALIV